MYTQPDSLRLTTPLGADALLLERFEGREAISEPYRFRLALLAEEGTDVPFEEILGAEVSVSLARPDGPARWFHGIVHRFGEAEQIAGPRGEPTFTRYEAEVVPRLFLLGQRAQSRVFASKTIPEILMEVLSGLDVVNQIQGRWEPREFCAQYRESDLAFASRLMEEEGIFYFFRHAPDGHQLVLANTPRSHPEVDRPNRVIYEKVAGGTRADERVVAWRKTQEIRSGRVTLRDYSFSMPDKDLEVSRAIQETADAGAVRHMLQVGGNADLEVYDYPGRYAQRFDEVEPGGQDRPQVLPRIFDDGLRTVGIRMQEEAASGLVVDGESGCRQFAAGHAFTLERHRNADGPYVLTEVEHVASVEGAYTRGEPATLTYRNKFRAIPASIPFRPARVTPRPRVGGPQTAVVVGPSADDPIFCDKFGRIKVQFHWDRVGSRDADSSCWIRVSQPWAGSNWGAITLPRVGQEVVVGFLEGDPDRPLILGSVYNAAQMPPFPLPANKTQSGMKTDSHRSADPQAFSGLGFEDADGGEHVHLHSQRHMTHSTEQNLYVNAANQHHHHVGKYSVRQVGGLPLMNHSKTTGKGGGAGGGSGLGAGNSPPYASAGPFVWNPAMLGGIAEDLDMVVGWRRCNTAGLYSTTTIGQTNATTINPIGLMEFFSPMPTAAGVVNDSPLGKLLGMKAGGLAAPLVSATIGVAIGGVTSLHYGPKIDIRRGGASIERIPSEQKKWQVATRIVGALYCLVSIGDLFVPMITEKLDLGTEGVIAEGAIAIALTDLVLGLWIMLETIDPSQAAAASQAMLDSSVNPILIQRFGAGSPAAFQAVLRQAQQDAQLANTAMQDAQRDAALANTAMQGAQAAEQTAGNAATQAGQAAGQAANSANAAGQSANAAANSANAADQAGQSAGQSATQASGSANAADQAAITTQRLAAKVTQQLEDIQTDIAKIKELAEKAEQKGVGDAEADVSGMRNHVSDSLYAINSPRISLVSALGLDPIDPSLIALQALGNEEYTGSVVIQGSGDAIMLAGEAAFVHVKIVEEVVGNITVDCGPTGTITLQSGFEKEPNSLVMEPEGITVASTLKIEAEVDESSITLTPEGITEAAAESSLSITPEGITLSVAESVVEITAEGIVLTSGPCSVEITPEGIMVNGLTIALTGDESVEVTAPEVIIL